MPAYNAATPFLLGQNHSFVVWNNETAAVSAKSQQVALYKDLSNSLSVEVLFAGAPGTFEVDLQTADTDGDAYYVTKGTITTVNAGNVGRLELTNVVARFARLVMVAKGNAVNVTASLSK